MNKKRNNIKILLMMTMALYTFSLNTSAMENKQNATESNILNKSFENKKPENNIFKNLNSNNKLKKSSSVENINNNLSLNKNKQKNNDKNIKKFNFKIKNINSINLNNQEKPKNNIFKNLKYNNVENINNKNLSLNKLCDNTRNKDKKTMEKIKIEKINLEKKFQKLNEYYLLIDKNIGPPNLNELYKKLNMILDNIRILHELIKELEYFENINDEEKYKIKSIVIEFAEILVKIKKIVENLTKKNYSISVHILDLMNHLISEYRSLKQDLTSSEFLREKQLPKIYRKMEEIENLIQLKKFKENYVNLFKQNENELKNNIENIIKKLDEENSDMIKEIQKLNDYDSLNNKQIRLLNTKKENLEKELSNLNNIDKMDKMTIDTELETLKTKNKYIYKKRDEILNKQEKTRKTIDALKYMLNKNLLSKKEINKLEEKNEENLKMEFKKLEKQAREVIETKIEIIQIDDKPWEMDISKLHKQIGILRREKNAK